MQLMLYVIFHQLCQFALQKRNTACSYREASRGLGSTDLGPTLVIVTCAISKDFSKQISLK